MSTGAILLGFLAIIFAILVGRTRRKMGMPVTLRTIAIAISGFVIVVLLLWAGSRNGHG